MDISPILNLVLLLVQKNSSLSSKITPVYIQTSVNFLVNKVNTLVVFHIFSDKLSFKLFRRYDNMIKTFLWAFKKHYLLHKIDQMWVECREPGNYCYHASCLANRRKIMWTDDKLVDLHQPLNCYVALIRMYWHALYNNKLSSV